jgi:hypothetical protein
MTPLTPFLEEPSAELLSSVNLDPFASINEPIPSFFDKEKENAKDNLLCPPAPCSIFDLSKMSEMTSNQTEAADANKTRYRTGSPHEEQEKMDFANLLPIPCEEQFFSQSEKESDETSVLPSESAVFTHVQPLMNFSFAQPLLATSSHSKISPEILSFFDRLCGEMIVMASEQSNRTTLVLNSDEFLSSPLYGAEITIEEFSTAPKIFNVSISAEAQAIELVQSQLSGFWEIFQERKFSFSINRVDTELLSKPVFSRRSGEDKNDLDQEQKDKKHS